MASEVNAAAAAPPRPGATARRGRPLWGERRDWLLRLAKLLPFLVIFVAWQWASDSGAISPVFYSSPLAIVESLWQWYSSGRILPHLGATVLELAIGLTLATVIGLVVGIWVGWSRTANDMVSPVLVFLYSVPVIAVGPVLALVLGIGMIMPVALILLLAVFPILFAVEAGVRTAPHDLIRMARHFGASDGQIIRTVLLPAAVPYLAGGLMVSIGRAMAGAVVGEWLASSTGLGSLIFTSAAIFETKTVYMAAFSIVGLSLLLSLSVGAFERWTQKWRP